MGGSIWEPGEGTRCHLASQLERSVEAEPTGFADGLDGEQEEEESSIASWLWPEPQRTVLP